jgi:hypothetical protein
LGLHGDVPIFEQAKGLHEEQAKGLHEEQAGLTVIPGAGPADPEVMFEEHATGEMCTYFEVLTDTALNESLGPAILNEEGRKRITDPDERVAWLAMRSAFMQENPAFVNELVRTIRTTAEAHGGAAPLIKVARRLQRRTAVIRMIHTARAQPERPFADILGGPHPLDLHSAGGEVFPTHLYTPLVLLASPFARGFVAGRAIPEATLTVALVLLMGGAGPVLRDADVTWSRLFEDGLPQLRKEDGEGTTWLRQTNHHALDLDAFELINWWTAQLNALYTEATDLGRFRADDGLFSAGNAYRELRSLDRIIASCVRIQARPDEHAVRVAAAFELFDLLPNVLDKPVSAKNLWATVANPANAGRILDAAFATAPGKISNVLRERARRVAERLRDESLEHVMPGRLVGGKVTIGADGSSTQQADVFIGQLFQQLRNTHHGYELDHQSKIDVLNLHSGHISAAFPEMAVLFALAIVAQPEVALAGDWF